jgi:succinyl-CoA synthetase beta subunit
MRIHEYQAKTLLMQYGIPIPRGRVAHNSAEAMEIANELKGRVILKDQVYAGGRGRAGGIKAAESPEEAERVANELIGTRLVTHQTGLEGVPVSKVLVEEVIEIEHEFYLSIIIDGVKQLPLMMASEAGGMEIEEVTQTTPEKIFKILIDPTVGFRPYQGRKLAYGIGLVGNQLKEAIQIMASLYELFMSKDCSLAEINPLALTIDDRLVAIDAKLNFEDNALFRHKDIQALQDKEQEDPLEIQAHEWGINSYIKLDGNIGCIVNGAGLAMATNDLIQHCDGRAANFLDVGTVNNTGRIVNSFKMFVTDPRVKVVLVNIFGGMARVDIIARGIVEAYQQMDIHFPLVIRLAGTNVEEGKRILTQSGISFIEAKDFYDSAYKAVEAARRIA